MAQNVGIPKLGLTMVEATIVEWQVGEKTKVEKDQPILVIETEKTTYNIGAIAPGILNIITPEGATVPVGHVVGRLAESLEEYEKITREGAPAIASVSPTKAAEQRAVLPSPAAAAAGGGGEKTKISPVARKLAEKEGVDIMRAVGTGPGGRITREDIEKLIAAGPQALAPVLPSAAAGSFPEAIPPTDMAEQAGIKRVRESIPLKGTRRTIANNLWRSLQTAAQMSSGGEVDATELIKFRKALVDDEKRLGVRITYTDIMVMVVARTLKMHPIVNSSLVGEEIKVWDTINIGVAVDIELAQMPGLIVPVVREADKKSLTEIHNIITAAAQKAKERRLAPDDVAGSTFTISSTGGAGGGGIREGGGSSFGTPILNLGEVGLLGVGAIVKRAVVVNDEIVIRPMLSYTFTTDHRVIDGVPAGRFVDTLTKFLTNPCMMLAD